MLSFYVHLQWKINEHLVVANCMVYLLVQLYYEDSLGLCFFRYLIRKYPLRGSRLVGNVTFLLT